MPKTPVHDAALAFRKAALGDGSFEDALNGLADVVGLRTGQMIALGRRSLVPLNIMTRMPDEAAMDFVAAGGSLPAVNSRVRIGSSDGELIFRDEADFTTADDRARSPRFAAWIDRYEIGYTCLTNLIVGDDLLVGLAGLQQAGRPPAGNDEKRAFMALAREAANAVRVQMALQADGLDLLAAALDKVAAAAIIVDLRGRVRRTTEAAETILSGAVTMSLQNDSLTFLDPAVRTRFETALGACLQSTEQPIANGAAAVICPDPHLGPIAIEVSSLPISHGFNFAAAALVVLRAPRAGNRFLEPLLKEGFGLTLAEGGIARLLLDGRSAADCAAATGTTVGTVRTHIHRILGKTGTRSVAELIALLAAYGHGTRGERE